MTSTTDNVTMEGRSNLQVLQPPLRPAGQESHTGTSDPAPTIGAYQTW